MSHCCVCPQGRCRRWRAGNRSKPDARSVALLGRTAGSVTGSTTVTAALARREAARHSHSVRDGPAFVVVREPMGIQLTNGQVFLFSLSTLRPCLTWGQRVASPTDS